MKERLYRSRNRVIGGVSAGLGDYLNIDPVIVRVLFIVFTLINGLGLLLYIILWIIVPEEPLPANNVSSAETEDGETIEAEFVNGDNAETASTNSTQKPPQNKNSGRVTAGIILIALGLFFILRRYIPIFHFWDFFPLLLIFLGGFLIWNSIRRKEDDDRN